jgi:hypothetical protein
MGRFPQPLRFSFFWPEFLPSRSREFVNLPMPTHREPYRRWRCRSQLFRPAASNTAPTQRCQVHTAAAGQCHEHRVHDAVFRFGNSRTKHLPRPKGRSVHDGDADDADGGHDGNQWFLLGWETISAKLSESQKVAKIPPIGTMMPMVGSQQARCLVLLL